MYNFKPYLLYFFCLMLICFLGPFWKSLQWIGLPNKILVNKVTIKYGYSIINTSPSALPPLPIIPIPHQPPKADGMRRLPHTFMYLLPSLDGARVLLQISFTFLISHSTETILNFIGRLFCESFDRDGEFQSASMHSSILRETFPALFSSFSFTATKLLTFLKTVFSHISS